MSQNNKYMKLALKQAEKCLINDDVPVGCVIIHNDKVIAKAYNKRVKSKSTTRHCEIIAIEKACKKIGDWRLEDCTMFVTLEPCPMCAGAILQARIKKVVIGTRSYKSGSCGTVCNIFNEEFTHKVEVEFGTMEEECKKMVQDFFKELRNDR